MREIVSPVLLPKHPGLFATSRLRALANQALSPSMMDWFVLALFGVLAACSSTFIDFSELLQTWFPGHFKSGLRIPGHSILRVVFPVALGLALVPRRGAGSVMGGTAAITGAMLQFAGYRGEGIGIGAMTSLIATGPLLDWTLRRANGGWRQIVSFALAGLASNLLAFGVRGAAKYMSWEKLGRRPLNEWLAEASVTYLACGVIAGLISGAILFSVRPRSESLDAVDNVP